MIFIKKYKQYISLIFAILVLLLTSYFMNSLIDNNYYFEDDLYEYYYYFDNNFMTFIFNYGNNRFRPFSNIFLFLRFSICRNNMTLAKLYSIFSFFCLGLVAYFVFYKISNYLIISLVSAFIIMFSRFSYYNATQMLGSIENVSIILLLLLCLFLFLFIKKRKHNYFLLTNICYFCIIFSHERYFIMFLPIIVAVLVMKNLPTKTRIVFASIPLFIFIFYFILKTYGLGIPFAVDTGSSKGLKIDVVSIMKNSFISFLNILQIPLSKDYLVGINLEMMNAIQKGFCYVTAFFSLILFILFLIILIKNIFKKENYEFYLFIIVTFGLLVSSVSVSHRIEMRFLYPAYIIFILICLCCFTDLIKYNHKKALFNFPLFLCCNLIFTTIMISNIDPFYYLFTRASEANFIANEIVYKNKEELKTKKLILVTDKSKVKLLHTFFRQFNEIKNGFCVFDDNKSFSELNKINFDDYLVVEYKNGKVQEFNKNNLLLNINNKWLEGNSNVFNCYTLTGNIQFDYYLPENFSDFVFDFYINDILVETQICKNDNCTYHFSYNNNELINNFFKFEVKSNKTYNPSLNGDSDIRELQLYVIDFESDKYINLINSFCNLSETEKPLVLCEDQYLMNLLLELQDREYINKKIKLINESSLYLVGQSINDYDVYRINNKKIESYDLPFDPIAINDAWTVGLSTSYLSYSNNGEFCLQFYVPKDFIDINYDIYINDKLVKSFNITTRDELFYFNYVDKTIEKSFINIKICSNLFYLPSDHNSNDIRELQMFIVKLNVN